MAATEGPVAAVIDLASQFRNEFGEEFIELRRRMNDAARNFNADVAGANESLREVQGSQEKRIGLVLRLKNLSPVGFSRTLLLKTFAWVAMMQMAHKLAFDFGCVLLRAPLGFFISNFAACAFLLLVLPAMAYNRLDAAADRHTRHGLLLFAALEGLALGHVFYDTQLDMPLPFVVPLAIALYSLLGPSSDAGGHMSRVYFLAASLGLGLVLNFVAGLVMGKLTVTYLLVALAYAGIALVTLQLYLDQSGGESKRGPYTLMLGFDYAAVIVQVVFLFLFGGTAST